MLDSSNVKISRFLRRIEETCGSFAIDRFKLRSLSPDTIGQGRALVKTALYHIRRGLKTGDVMSVSLDDQNIVQYFATPKNVDELFNLGGFEAFWSQEDRGLRMAIIKKLGELVTEKDLPRLIEFSKRLEQISYETVEEYDEELGREITYGGTEWNEMDRDDFARIMQKATSTAYHTVNA